MSFPFLPMYIAQVIFLAIVWSLCTVILAAVIPRQAERPSMLVGIPLSQERLHAPKAVSATSPASTDGQNSTTSPLPFSLGTYQVDPFHTISLRADHSALIAAQQLCFQQSDCPASTFTGSWSFAADTQQLRVATTSPIVSAMRWHVVLTPSPSPQPSDVLRMKVVPGSEEGDFPIEPRLNGGAPVGISTLRALGRANVDHHPHDNDDTVDDPRSRDGLREGEEPWMYIEGP